jgi:hypothetical protein
MLKVVSRLPGLMLVSVLAATGVATAAEPPAFPEADRTRASNGLVFQIALSEGKLIRGERLTVYGRFTNAGATMIGHKDRDTILFSPSTHAQPPRSPPRSPPTVAPSHG